MIYDDFVLFATSKYKSIFSQSKYGEIINNKKAPDLYKYYDLVKVCVPFDDLYVCFVPAEKIEKINNEYSYLNVDFVFATSDGDPVFLDNGKVYTCPHGTSNPKKELLANSFEDFIEKIIK